MNTVAFAEEAPVEEATVEAEASDAEIAEAPVEDEVAAPEAAVDDVDDTAYNKVSDATGMTIHVDPEDGESPVTKITYGPSTDKNKPAYNVVTMTDVTNPVSWNNFYGAGLLRTAIFGSNEEDAYLNNSKEIPVSENGIAGETIPEGYWADNGQYSYAVIPVDETAGVYLLTAWGFIGEAREYVDGVATPAVVNAWGRKESEKIPVKVYDGRKIQLYKTGKATATSVEDLVVKATLVKYEGAETGTVTEYADVKVDGIKVSKEAEKASVKYATKMNEYTYNSPKSNEEKYTFVDNEKKTLVEVDELIGSALPSFQITKISTKDKDAKKLATAAKKAVKDIDFLFAVKQKPIIVEDVVSESYYDDDLADYVDVNFASEYAEGPKDASKFVHVGIAEVNDEKFNGIRSNTYVLGAALKKAYVDKINTASGDEIKDSKADDGTVIPGIESKISKAFMEGDGYNYGVDSDEDGFDIGGLTITKFDQDKAKATIQFTVVTNNGKGKGGTKTRTLKQKDDFTLAEGTLAGQKVTYLEFPENGNFTYAKLAPTVTGTTGAYKTSLTSNDLSAFGYKWAFRQTPTTDKKKATTFRRGIYVEPSIGFVYEQ